MKFSVWFSEPAISVRHGSVSNVPEGEANRFELVLKSSFFAEIKYEQAVSTYIVKLQSNVACRTVHGDKANKARTERDLSIKEELYSKSVCAGG